MSVEKVTYLDSSAIVKLVIKEPESRVLQDYVRRRSSLISSTLAYTEVLRALLPFGSPAMQRGEDVLSRIELIRMNRALLIQAGKLPTEGLRSLEAIHLATAQLVGASLGAFVVYDVRLAAAAASLGMRVVTPK